MRRHEGTTSRRRSGFTILELLISMVVLMVFVGMAASAVQTQGRAVTREAGRQVALHGARAAVTTIERELRVAGANLALGQPVLVEGGPRSIVFNTDLVSTLPGDPFASYVNPNADSAAVAVWNRMAQLELPASGRTYPESTYMESAGVPGAAETIAFWVAPDETSPRDDEYVLYRRVNGAEPEVLARGLVLGASDTIFRYFRPDTLGVLRQFPSSSLPLVHRAAMHASAADSGASVRPDSVKMVQVTMQTRSRDPRGGESLRRSSVTVRIVNTAMAGRTTCGQPPFGVQVTANPATVNGAAAVRVQWGRDLDDGGGEKDVQRYVIYRRLSTAPAFANPLASIPAGQASYTFIDSDVVSGQRWIYGVASQDCTPATSQAGISSTVTIP
jgi:type II secretory pathway pseudopilin PulG